MERDEIYTFFDAEKMVYQFEEVLNKYQIEIARNSELERLCLNIVDIVQKHLKPNLRQPEVDIRPYFREFLGMQDLMTKIIRAERDKGFKQLIPHLNKLNIANPLQNRTTSVESQDNNKLFELFIAALCVGLSPEEIVLDNPDVSKGDNPDIIATVNGKKIGLGCKALHSLNPQSIFKNIEKAVDQIEKSAAESGLPVITLKNVIKHDDFWPLINDADFRKGEDPIFGAFLDLNVPLSKISEVIENIKQDLINNIGISEIKILFKGKKSEPGCLIYCPTTTSMVMNQLPVTTRLNIFNLLTFDTVSNECLDLLVRLNHQLQLT
ncbi:MAG: hypothetical protein HY097_00700 [Nitrospinae bacterium]|nr:hypothetical protein [Nitrospinota bacterium]MBI3815051.1 hypothetical protein [Nitrospinota bacterium]